MTSSNQALSGPTKNLLHDGSRKRFIFSDFWFQIRHNRTNIHVAYTLIICSGLGHACVRSCLDQGLMSRVDGRTTSWPCGSGLDPDDHTIIFEQTKGLLKLLLWVSRWHFQISENGKTDFRNSKFSNFYLVLETFFEEIDRRTQFGSPKMSFNIIFMSYGVYLHK